MSKHLSLQRELCFIEIIEGETDGLERQLEEYALVDRLKELDVQVRSIEMNAAGCFLVVDCEDVARVRIAARPFNLAVRLHERCGLLTLRGRRNRAFLPLLRDVISIFHERHVRIVQIAAVDAALSVLVEEDDVATAMPIMEALAELMNSVAA